MKKAASSGCSSLVSHHDPRAFASRRRLAILAQGSLRLHHAEDGFDYVTRSMPELRRAEERPILR